MTAIGDASDEINTKRARSAWLAMQDTNNTEQIEESPNLRGTEVVESDDETTERDLKEPQGNTEESIQYRTFIIEVDEFWVTSRAEWDCVIIGHHASGATSGTYVYDGNLKRVKQVVGGKTIYNVYSTLTGKVSIVDNATSNERNVMIDAGAATVRWNPVSGAEITYLDGLGSPVASTDWSGNVVWRDSYTPFGEKRVDPTGNRDKPSFTGHIDDDATGLTYMQARYYEPTLGRFLASDPVGFVEGGATHFNRYTYVANNPINSIDPNGLEAFYISRPVYFRSMPADHAFVGVKDDKTGEITIFSYTTDEGKLRPSDPNEAGGTYETDLAYFKEFLADRGSVPGNKINASDETVRAVGNALNEALEINDIDYEVFPTVISDGCNSNCAAGVLADEAVESEGGRGHPAPASAQGAPGRGFRDRLDRLIQNRAEQRRSDNFRDGLGKRCRAGEWCPK